MQLHQRLRGARLCRSHWQLEAMVPSRSACVFAAQLANSSPAQQLLLFLERRCPLGSVSRSLFGEGSLVLRLLVRALAAEVTDAPTHESWWRPGFNCWNMYEPNFIGVEPDASAEGLGDNGQLVFVCTAIDFLTNHKLVSDFNVFPPILLVLCTSWRRAPERSHAPTHSQWLWLTLDPLSTKPTRGLKRGDADHARSGGDGDGDVLRSSETVEGEDEPPEQIDAPLDDLLHRCGEVLANVRSDC